MCGIAGFTVAPGDRGLLDTYRMTYSLGIDMMARGTDATGIATVDFKGRLKVRKAARAANVFLAERKGIGRASQSLLLHTRAATQGRPENNLNNHPIEYGNIVGIHNGIVYNDDALFKHFDWDRNGQVDSEAIFAALHHLDRDEALTNIDAGWAVAWLQRDDPRKLWLARGYSSPLFYALTVNGSVVFASTEHAVKEAFQWGGVNGDANVIKAPEGFLAHTDPDNGGLIVLPEFDGSGTDAIGARTYKGKNNWGGHFGGEEWEYASRTYGGYTPATSSAPNTTSRTSVPGAKAYERVTISGDPKNPKVGDRRRYFDSAGVIHTEVCISSSGVTGSPGTWSLAVGADSPRPVPPVHNTAIAPINGRLPVDVIDPFDEADEIVDAEMLDDLAGLDDDAYWTTQGFPQVGDVIRIPKDRFHGGVGGVYGKVLDYDAHDGTITVDFFEAVIDVFADYEIGTNGVARTTT